MRRLFIFLLSLLLLSGPSFATDEVRLLGKEDLEIATGGTGAAETSVSSGGVTSTKIDATHLKLRASPGNSVETELGLKMNKSTYDADSDGDIDVAGGGTGATTAANARANLGVTIGTNVQAYDTDLDSLSSPTAWSLFQANGSGAIVEITPGANGTYARSNGAGALITFDTPVGTGDIVGPSSSIDNQIVLFDSTTGKVIKASECTIDATGITCPQSTTDQGEYRFYELSGNGGNYIALVGQDNVATNTEISVPESAGTLGVAVAAPSAASDACVAGNYAYDADYFYICRATDTWERAAIATW